MKLHILREWESFLKQILLQRLVPLLEEKGIPHHTQSAYQAGISCADSTEVVQEAVGSHIQI